MERLMEKNNFPAHRLLVEYRMEKEIYTWPNNMFYSGMNQNQKYQYVPS